MVTLTNMLECERCEAHLIELLEIKVMISQNAIPGYYICEAWKSVDPTESRAHDITMCVQEGN